MLLNLYYIIFKYKHIVDKLRKDTEQIIVQISSYLSWVEIKPTLSGLAVIVNL